MDASGAFAQVASAVANSAGNSPTVLWMGAGASFSLTKGALPLCEKLFDAVDRVHFPALSTVLGELDEGVRQNGERVIQCLDDFSASNCLLECVRPSVTPELVARARKEMQRYLIQRLSVPVPALARWAGHLIDVAGTDTTVITTNYDTFAERLLSCRSGQFHGHIHPSCPHCRMKRILRENCECTPRGQHLLTPWAGSVLKLHGSIAWLMCRQPGCAQHGCVDPDDLCRPVKNQSCRCCGGIAEPVIVVPSQRKRYDEYCEIRRMWAAAKNALAEMQNFIVWGTSFPEADGMIRQLLQQSLAQQNHQLRIAVIDVNPAPIEATIRACVPANRPVQFMQPLVPSRDHSG